MTRPRVVIAETLSPATLEALGPHFDVVTCDGTDRTALLTAVREADALLVRSATVVDAEVFRAASRLTVVARAGVGLDNVDVGAATQAGVMVVNAPTSNIVSAAEHAIALLLAVARNIAPASASLRSGEWSRARFTGVELFEKTLGIVGLGRIGVLVAQRMAAFGMDLVAYDPYVSTVRAAALGVRLSTLEELLATADFVTVHLPRTPETIGLIGADELAGARRGIRIVNAARGGIVDEAALAEAIRSGQVGGAGIDVFAVEPTTESPLFGFDNVVVTPHLGASTVEAQERAGIAVATSVRLALAGDIVPDAVNVSGGVIDERVRPGIALTETLGRTLTALCTQVPAHLDIEVRGEIAALDVSVLRLAALKGVFADVVAEQVTYVNAPAVADERGMAVRLVTEDDAGEFRNTICLRATMADGEVRSVAGTVTGPTQVPKLVGVDGYDLEVPFAEHLLVLWYDDRPGVIGAIGQVLGAAGINIAAMQVGRSGLGGSALSVLSVDSAVPPDLLVRLDDEIGARRVRSVDLAATDGSTPR